MQRNMTDTSLGISPTVQTVQDHTQRKDNRKSVYAAYETYRKFVVMGQKRCRSLPTFITKVKLRRIRSAPIMSIASTNRSRRELKRSSCGIHFEPNIDKILGLAIRS